MNKPGNEHYQMRKINNCRNNMTTVESLTTTQERYILELDLTTALIWENYSFQLEDSKGLEVYAL